MALWDWYHHQTPHRKRETERTVLAYLESVLGGEAEGDMSRLPLMDLRFHFRQPLSVEAMQRFLADTVVDSIQAQPAPRRAVDVHLSLPEELLMIVSIV